MKLFEIKRYKLRLVLLVFIVIIAYFTVPEYIANQSVKVGTNELKIPTENYRVLVFAPHNDDEVLGAGVFIKKTLEHGGSVKVVMITNGDGFKQGIQLDYLKLMPKSKDYIRYGYTRQNETINALRELGLSKKNIIFLGYPDGGISDLWNYNWEVNNSYRSGFTGVNKSIYTNSFTKNAPYTGESLASDICKIIKEYKPTCIVYPHPDDHHPDHWATNAFVKYVLTTINYKLESELLYLVHRGDWPTPLFKDTADHLLPPAKLLGEGTEWYYLRLSPNDLTEKSNAISLYKTQMKPLGPLLTAFERMNELFGVYPDAKLINRLSDDNEITPNGNNLVIPDPTQDGVGQKLFKGTDISGVYGEISKENNLHLFIKMTASLDKLVTYKANVIFINNGSTERLNLILIDDKLSFTKPSSLSITGKNKIQWNTKRNLVHIIIPLSGAKEFKCLFIDAETFFKGILMDKTAWRMIDK